MQQVIEFAGNHPFLSGAWVILAIMLVYSYINSAFSPVKELGTHEATLQINKEDALVLDIRPPADFKKGHILGSRQLKPEEIREADFSKLEKHKGKPIIVACAMGNSARKTALQLTKAGFPNVSVLKGGVNAWTGAGLPVSK
ncbi:rhodanese-like domain-containing protein [Alteromonas sp. ASW11-36]|uniref:Rhodanese-like domain-containing protein n=1 Tax=Alteromonas arenosi TaxID=3055817 RepID=A0ABT7SZI6_9ALTE|nr:rhodanese-like domain-containing protein [Alteromonas sp. ASW11-36]MDM7861586.1 rhodanese-like domain-containing protein [Alteromonas sp. ASW11-36]